MTPAPYVCTVAQKGHYFVEVEFYRTIRHSKPNLKLTKLYLTFYEIVSYLFSFVIPN